MTSVISMPEMEKAFLGFLNPVMDSTKGVTHGWPLMSLTSAVTSVALYLLFVSVGYQVMSARKDIVSLRPFQYVYNAFQVLLCGYLTIRTAVVASSMGYSLVCNQFDPYNAAGELPMLLYVFYLSKLLDFADTVFIIMHKKDKQLSFLHLYHHVTIFSIYWMNANVFYQGDIYYTIVANGGVHTIMYFYYFVSMFKERFPALAKPLQASRPVITLCQLFQFVTMQAQAITLLYGSTECSDSPLRIVGFYLVYIFSLFCLFMNFAFKNYCGGKRKQKKDFKKEA